MSQVATISIVVVQRHNTDQIKVNLISKLTKMRHCLNRNLTEVLQKPKTDGTDCTIS